MAHEAGKGDTQRPTNHQKFAESFERIFGKQPPQNVAEEVKRQVIDAVNLVSDPAGLKFKETNNVAIPTIPQPEGRGQQDPEVQP